VIVVGTLLLLGNASVAKANSDAELDSLTAQFSSSLGSINDKLGFKDGSGQISPSAADAEEQLKKLYHNIETMMTEARREAALSRSMMVSKLIGLAF